MKLVAAMVDGGIRVPGGHFFVATINRSVNVNDVNVDSFPASLMVQQSSAQEVRRVVAVQPSATIFGGLDDVFA